MDTIKQALKQRLTPEQLERLTHFIGRSSFLGFFIGLIFGRNLTRLAQIYGTDKWGSHYYTPHYQHYLKKFRRKNINLLEIGVGGYERPDRGGQSLRMWKRYFKRGNIYAIDIYDKSPQEAARIRIFQGSQVDTDFLDAVERAIAGPIDIIVDDGSHINEHVVTTFKHLFPKLKPGGVYVVEDTQTSYWPDYGGDSDDLENPQTMMNFFKKMPDRLNHTEFRIKDYQPDYFDENIASIHFYHNLIFISKRA